jgi:hypothetical protein
MVVFQTAKLRRGVHMFRATRSPAGSRQIKWRKTDSNFWSHLQKDSVSPARPFVFWRPAAPAAIVLVSENDDFELPASQSNLARRAL